MIGIGWIFLIASRVERTLQHLSSLLPHDFFLDSLVALLSVSLAQRKKISRIIKSTAKTD